MDVLRRGWQQLQGADPLIDGLPVLVLGVAAVGQLLWENPHDLVRVAPVLGTVVPLLWRRRYPLTCYFAQFGAALLTARPPVTASLVAMFLGLFSIGVYCRWRLPSLLAPAGVAAVLAVAFPDSYPTLPAWGLQLLGGWGVWLMGNVVRDRQLRADMLEERAGRLEREQDLATRVALAEERARLARELHDVVAHSVSVMVVQAGAARTLLGRRPERAGEALLAVEASGREALAELRRLLGVLTDDGAAPALDPQPGLDQLDLLVDRVAKAGLPVEVRIEGPPHPLPPGLDLTAYRIIQEALTNALKHAGGAPTQVVVRFLEGELQLEVADAGLPGGAPGGAGDGPPGDGPASRPAADGAGRGLSGMQERVAVYGGELEAGPRPAGGFAVRARLPLEPT